MKRFRSVNLSGELQGNYALLVSPDGGELIKTPQLSSASNGVIRTGRLVLDGQGNVKAEITNAQWGHGCL
jgi:hypothetical protein